MRFTFVTLFPEIVEGYFGASILGRALEAGHIAIDYRNPRDYSASRYKKVDEPMIGGGAGMLMSPQPLHDTLKELRSQSPKAHVIFLSPVGKPFRQNDAKRLAGKEHLVLVAGRYEGIDERIIELHADEIFSVGDAVLTGGELPAMMVCDAVSRLLPGVLGNQESLEVESFEASLLEAPSFTKPDEFEKKRAISEFLKGNHSKIAAIKNRMALCKTKYFRPDLYQRAKAKV
ncbi:tRNA (guanosine(37)-N1)-methyltransferase TrmD [Nitratifractor salsuginis]|uniref:tRNA (guanine-N(1)-)-methyltransferase n=1 Tax=Nitratifractor salsuginis (strain DSM 16511 / JCM 12458 / E9I37-1) TaxID=749222 RepID=E6WZC0_NITSE|nr:tRNA (guanosine(37)-N1)-methyltransferase TrmD [Nitratifractor salsuginis]ADV46632.1 tRNA (Guanine37-N(1)-) methyltransferase [Nitratifractor salsuginis DSM 16511]